jgi:hypothetical protein
MVFSVISVILMMSFDIGPTVGAFVPVQDEGDPWKGSFLLGVKVRYGLQIIDIDGELQFTSLGIDPDSSRGYDYSMIPLSLGVSRNFIGIRMGLGGAIYNIEAKADITEELQAVWKGSYPGMYISLGKDIPLGGPTTDLSAKFNIINFDGLWIGLTASVLF